MSIQSEIDRLSAAKTSIGSSLNTMGVTTAEGDTLDDYATALASVAASAPWLPLAGGTMTGALTLSGDPTADLQPATKQYADTIKPKATLVTLSASGWDSSAKTQTVTVSGVLADESKQLILPCPSAASISAYTEAGILCTGQAANSLTFTAETVPSTNLSVYVTVQEVQA